MCSYISAHAGLVEALHWIGLAALVLMLFVCAPLSYWVLGRPFDRQLKNSAKAGPDFWFGWFSTLYLRPITYAVKVVTQTQRSIDNVQQSNFAPFVVDRLDYGTFNFKKNATPTQKIFSYLYIGTMLTILLVLAPLFEICDLWL